MSEVNSFYAADDFSGELCVLLSEHLAALDAQRLRADTAEDERNAVKDESKALAELDDTTIAKLGSRLKAAEQRADTAERALANCNLALKAQTFNFETQKAKLAAAEQRIAELLQICRDIQDDPRLWLMVRAELSGRINAALNPNPEAESHE